MPTLETPDGKPVDATAEADAINSAFDQAMNDDGLDTQAPPKRTPKPKPDADAPAPRRGRPPKAEQARTTAKPAVTLDDGQRAEGVKGVAQIGAALALMFGKATGNPAFTADAITINCSADAIADACVQTARADARFAAVLDRVCASGPYAALISVAVGVGAQCARNHKPSLAIPGTVDPAELLQAQETADVPQAA